MPIRFFNAKIAKDAKKDREEPQPHFRLCALREVLKVPLGGVRALRVKTPTALIPISTAALQVSSFRSPPSPRSAPSGFRSQVSALCPPPTSMLRLRTLAPALLLPFLFLLSFPLRAQTADDANEGLRLEPDPATNGAHLVRWWGRHGRTYFLQQSQNLAAPWSYLPVIEQGNAQPVSYGLLLGDTPFLFVRLLHTDQTFSGSPYAADFDGDGLSNGWELSSWLDPLVADSSSDGDADGFTSLAEYQTGTSLLFRDSNGLGLEVYTP